jgi:hypothetical protein
MLWGEAKDVVMLLRDEQHGVMDVCGCFDVGGEASAEQPCAICNATTYLPQASLCM